MEGFTGSSDMFPMALGCFDSNAYVDPAQQSHCEKACSGLDLER